MKDAESDSGEMEGKPRKGRAADCDRSTLFQLLPPPKKKKISFDQKMAKVIKSISFDLAIAAIHKRLNTPSQLSIDTPIS